MLNASIVSESGRAGISVFGQSRHRSGYDHDGDGFTELPVISSQSVGMRSLFRTGAYSRITAQYHHIDEYRRGGDLLKQPPHEAFRPDGAYRGRLFAERVEDQKVVAADRRPPR